jgi:hypothetical protein
MAQSSARGLWLLWEPICVLLRLAYPLDQPEMYAKFTIFGIFRALNRTFGVDQGGSGLRPNPKSTPTGPRN